MPMMKGHSPKVISSNVKEMMKAGHSQKVSVAASLAHARKYKKMKGFSEGGEVQGLEHGGMEDMPDPEMAKGGQDESMAEMDSKGPEDYERTIIQIGKQGESLAPDEVSNPEELAEAQGFAQALRKMAMSAPGPENYAKGGLVQAGPEEDEKLHGNQPEGVVASPSEPMSSEPKKPGMVSYQDREPSGMGLSDEAKKALMMKKKMRKYGAYDPGA